MPPPLLSRHLRPCQTPWSPRRVRRAASTRAEFPPASDDKPGKKDGSIAGILGEENGPGRARDLVVEGRTPAGVAAGVASSELAQGASHAGPEETTQPTHTGGWWKSALASTSSLGFSKASPVSSPQAPPSPVDDASTTAAAKVEQKNSIQEEAPSQHDGENLAPVTKFPTTVRQRAATENTTRVKIIKHATFKGSKYDRGHLRQVPTKGLQLLGAVSSSTSEGTAETAAACGAITRHKSRKGSEFKRVHVSGPTTVDEKWRNDTGTRIRTYDGPHYRESSDSNAVPEGRLNNVASLDQNAVQKQLQQLFDQVKILQDTLAIRSNDGHLPTKADSLTPETRESTLRSSGQKAEHSASSRTRSPAPMPPAPRYVVPAEYRDIRILDLAWARYRRSTSELVDIGNELAHTPSAKVLPIMSFNEKRLFTLAQDAYKRNDIHTLLALGNYEPVPILRFLQRKSLSARLQKEYFNSAKVLATAARELESMNSPGAAPIAVAIRDRLRIIAGELKRDNNIIADSIWRRMSRYDSSFGYLTHGSTANMPHISKTPPKSLEQGNSGAVSSTKSSSVPEIDKLHAELVATAGYRVRRGKDKLKRSDPTGILSGSTSLSEHSTLTEKADVRNHRSAAGDQGFLTHRPTLNGSKSEEAVEQLLTENDKATPKGTDELVEGIVGTTGSTFAIGAHEQPSTDLRELDTGSNTPVTRRFDSEQKLARRIHTQSRLMKSSDHSKTDAPITPQNFATSQLLKKRSSAAPEDANSTKHVPSQAEELNEQSLIEELFPEANSNPLPQLPEKRENYAKLRLPESKASTQHKVIDRPQTLKEQVVESLQKGGERITILQLEHCSTELTEVDFRRLIPKGKHIEGWNRDGEFYKIIPGRDPLSLERLPFYYLLFKTPESAYAYQNNVTRLHKLAALHQSSSILSAIPAPRGFLEDGEDIGAVTKSYLLKPTEHTMTLRTLMQPYHPALRAMIDQGGYTPIVPNIDEKGNRISKVLMHIEGYEPTRSDLFKIFRRDAYQRGMQLNLRNESSFSINKLRDLINLKTHVQPITTTNPWAFDRDPNPSDLANFKVEFEDPSIASWMKVDDNTIDASTDINQMVMNRVYNRWVIEFEDEDEARRFKVQWHRRMLPELLRGDKTWRDYEEVRMCNCEVLW